MNERQLKIFKTVCSHGNMTLAAKELYISQSSVSQTITEIERQYDILLFERIGKKLYITKSGEKLLFFANQILSLHKNLYSSLKSDSIHEELRIGATITIGTYLLPSIISQFNNITENTEVYSYINNTTVISQMIINNTIDFGLVEGEIVSNNIITIPYMNDDLVLICSNNHELATGNTLLPFDLQMGKFIIREPNSGSRALLLKELKQKEIDYIIKGEYNNTEAIINAVKMNLGIGVISRKSITKENSKFFTVLKTDFLDLSRKFFIAYHKNKVVTKTMLKIFTSLQSSD